MDKKMEFTDVKETVKCFCHKLRNRPLKSVHAHKTARGNVCYIFIFLTLVILLLCVIVYVICTVQKLTAKYEESLHTINFLRNDIYSLKQKYRQLDRRLKTSTKMISANAGDIEVGANGFKEVNHLPAEFTEVRTDRKSASSLQETKPEPLIRKKRAKKQRKKKCRNCLPAIQIEGSGGLQYYRQNPDISGVWTPSSWLKQYQIVDSAFHYSRVSETGSVSVRKSGLYLIYAQVTLIGEIKRGYKLLLKQKDGNISTLAVCKRHLIKEGVSESDSCCTVKVVLLKKGAELFMREDSENTGANYLKSNSYFGLVRLGNVA